ncbi:hypothetical protein T484DRAFT_1826225 [Baffinella frigidus]|nr:hypothetical protein T484DRAFT_1826225 [Cryptophyta sp. CCMP2293]
MAGSTRAAMFPLLALALLGAASAALAPTAMPTTTAAGLTLVPASRNLQALPRLTPLPALPALRGGAAGSPNRVAILTAGGLAPCLSSAIG